MSAPSTEVGPGFLAFLFFFVLAVALWLLLRNMFARIRRMNLAERSEQARREQQDPPSGGPRGSTGEQPGGSGVGGDGPEEGKRRGDEV